MFDFFTMADDLEQSGLKLRQAKAMLCVTGDGLFKDNQLDDFYQQYEAVLDAALDKVMEQIKVVEEVSRVLYDVSKKIKGA